MKYTLEELEELTNQQQQRSMPPRLRGEGLGGVPLGSFAHGGKVKKTGLYKLHKGERVVPLASMRRMKRPKH